MLTFIGIGGAVLHAVNAEKANPAWRKLGVISHGVGLLLLLLGGFGALAKLKISWQGWVIVKIGIWVVIGALPFFLRRKPDWGVMVWFAAVLLGAVAAYMAIFHPF